MSRWEIKMLAFENVTFKYPDSDKKVLKDISFKVEKGSFISIIGASGSGKTTLFRLINGLDKADSGSITIDGTEINSLKNYASYMPQQDLLFPWLNVMENVMLPMTVQKRPKKEKTEKAMEMLKQVGLADWADKKVKQLSGGMKQRVSFARTLCVGADLLLLDEPFSALDSITRITMQEWLLEQWKQLGKTIIFVTHDVEEALFLSQKVLVLKGNPVDSIEEYKVPCGNERNRDMLTSQEIVQLRETLISRLRQESAYES